MLNAYLLRYVTNGNNAFVLRARVHIPNMALSAACYVIDRFSAILPRAFHPAK